MEIRDHYLNPFTDFGFKKLFGEEPNKDLLLDFLSEQESELLSYEDSLKYYRDLKNSLDTAKEEGRMEGIIQVIKKGKRRLIH